MTKDRGTQSERFTHIRNNNGNYKWYLPGYQLSQHLPEIRKARDAGERWDEIGARLGMSKTWANNFYWTHYGKVCHEDLRGLDLTRVPRKGLRIKRRAKQIEEGWRCLQEGGSPDDVATLWIMNGVPLKRRSLMVFLTDWMRAVAEDVWGREAQDLERIRKARSLSGAENTTTAEKRRGDQWGRASQPQARLRPDKSPWKTIAPWKEKPKAKKDHRDFSILDNLEEDPVHKRFIRRHHDRI
jgi:hypothetical protein